jgi:hypothetical protein
MKLESRQASRLVCVPPKVRQSCDLEANDSTILVVILAGFVCLLFASAWLAFFDFRGLPILIKRLERSLSGEANSRGRGAPRHCGATQANGFSSDVSLPPPMPPSFTQALGPPGPPGEPPAGAATRYGAGGMCQDLRLVADSPDLDIVQTSPTELALQPPSNAGATSTTSPTSNQDPADNAAASVALADRPPSGGESHGSDNTARSWSDMSMASDGNSERCSGISVSASTVDSAGGATQRLPSHDLSRKNTVRWPVRLNRLWAFRVVFFRAASAAVCARILHPIACALVTWHVSASDLVAIVVAIMFGAAPLAWCARTTKPPQAGPAAGVPDGIASCCCWKVPRLTFYVVVTVVLETYCTVSTASSVLRAPPCEQPLWQTALLHCSGILVTVLRVYTALLAIRLQDQFSSCCRRVLPVAPKLVAPPLTTMDIVCDIGIDVEPDTAPAISIEKLRPPGDSHRALNILAAHLGDRNVSRKSTGKMAGYRCRSKSAENRHCPWRRWLLRLSLVLAVIIASVSLWVVYALKEDPEEDLPSSCATAQNATATCSPFESIGERYWDASQGESRAALADTVAACCQGCDKVDGCQGWMFERPARKCRWIRFTEAPCKEKPGDLECRCLTHQGTAFGFKPTTKVVWMQRPGT